MQKQNFALAVLAVTIIIGVFLIGFTLAALLLHSEVVVIIKDDGFYPSSINIFLNSFSSIASKVVPSI